MRDGIMYERGDIVLLSVLIDNTLNGKLPFRSWVNSYRIFTVDERVIKRKLCCVDEKFLEKVIGKFNEYVG